MSNNNLDYQSRGLIKYTSRDYDSLMAEFWNLVPKLTDLWRPEADSDPGVVLGKILASAADMLGINLDILATELFGPSVTQRKNAEKLFSLIGYHLGWYTAARTEVTFTNNTEEDVSIDFGFNGSNFATLNAYTDITGQSRVITYNILPLTNTMGASETRSTRDVISSSIDVFSETDRVLLHPRESITRVAVEGELRSVSVSVEQIKNNNYLIKLPSQHLDTTAVWIRAKSSAGGDVGTQWVQCASNAEFITPEPRFAVTYDNYSNAQIQVSNYLNQLENYENNYLVIYWIDCSGVIGCVGENVLRNLLLAKPGQTVSAENGDITISNLSNTVELPHTHTVTGRSPETAKEAYYNSKNYINTWDSLVTLPDYNRFLNREPGVDCGVVIDCEKALKINLAIYHDDSLTESQKRKMYITNYDFPAGDVVHDWSTVLNMDFDPENPPFAANFKNYTAMCFAIHNDFQNSSYGQGQVSNAQISNTLNFMRYKPPQQFITDVIRDYTPLQSMSVKLEFGYARIFKFFVVGQIFTKKPVSVDVGNQIIERAREALRLFYSPASRTFGAKPTVMEVVEVIQRCDDRVLYFDGGSPSNPIINWQKCDPEYFNAISFAKFEDLGTAANNLRIAPSCLIK